MVFDHRVVAGLLRARELGEELGVLVDSPVDGPVVLIREDDAGLEPSIWIVGLWDGGIVNAAPDVALRY